MADAEKKAAAEAAHDATKAEKADADVQEKAEEAKKGEMPTIEKIEEAIDEKLSDDAIPQLDGDIDISSEPTYCKICAQMNSNLLKMLTTT